MGISPILQPSIPENVEEHKISSALDFLSTKVSEAWKSVSKFFEIARYAISNRVGWRFARDVIKKNDFNTDQGVIPGQKVFLEVNKRRNNNMNTHVNQLPRNMGNSNQTMKFCGIDQNGNPTTFFVQNVNLSRNIEDYLQVQRKTQKASKAKRREQQFNQTPVLSENNTEAADGFEAKSYYSEGIHRK